MTGKTIKEISADIRKCDFRGCTVFGKFQNSRAKLEYNDENLPKEYIQRLGEFKVPSDSVPATDDVYIAMMDGNIIRGMSALDKVKQMVDYSLVNLKEGIWKYRTVIRDYKIDISYTGAFLYQYGLESIGRENYYIDLDGRAREAYLQGDLDFVEAVFKDLDKETKRSIVSLALKDGREKFVSRHKKELRGVQKKYFEARGTRGVAVEQTGKLKEDLISEYNEKKFVELEIDLMRADLAVRDELIKEIYRRGDLSFVQKYLTAISKGLKCEIFGNEYTNGNIDFVYRNFDKMEECPIKESILKKEFQDSNYKFLYEKYPFIKNKELKEKIMAHAYKEENIDFLNKFIDDMPKNMKLEAAIKFKDLKLSKAEKIMLLKK